MAKNMSAGMAVDVAKEIVGIAKNKVSIAEMNGVNAEHISMVATMTVGIAEEADGTAD